MNKRLCFACGRKLGKNPFLADTRDDQIVHVGSECIKVIRAAGNDGLTVSGFGGKLYALTSEQIAILNNGMRSDVDNQQIAAKMYLTHTPR
jgi:hypothetical protein